MKIYKVISRYIDNKKNQFELNIIEAEAIPENTFVSLKTRDIYYDYFSDRKTAEKFIEDSKNNLI